MMKVSSIVFMGMMRFSASKSTTQEFHPAAAAAVLKDAECPVGGCALSALQHRQEVRVTAQFFGAPSQMVGNGAAYCYTGPSGPCDTRSIPAGQWIYTYPASPCFVTSKDCSDFTKAVDLDMKSGGFSYAFMIMACLPTAVANKYEIEVGANEYNSESDCRTAHPVYECYQGPKSQYGSSCMRTNNPQIYDQGNCYNTFKECNEYALHVAEMNHPAENRVASQHFGAPATMVGNGDAYCYSGLAGSCRARHIPAGGWIYTYPDSNCFVTSQDCSDFTKALNVVSNESVSVSFAFAYMIMECIPTAVAKEYGIEVGSAVYTGQNACKSAHPVYECYYSGSGCSRTTYASGECFTTLEECNEFAEDAW